MAQSEEYGNGGHSPVDINKPFKLQNNMCLLIVGSLVIFSRT